MTVMHLWEYYEDYSDELKVAQKLDNINTIIYGDKELLILYDVDDDVYQITIHSDKGFTIGKILYELIKYLYKHLERYSLYDSMEGHIYVEHIGYEIIIL